MSFALSYLILVIFGRYFKRFGLFKHQNISGKKFNGLIEDGIYLKMKARVS